MTAEIGAFIDLLNSEGVKSYGEIGAREGDTFHLVMSALPEGSKGVAMDMPGAEWGARSSRDRLSKAIGDLIDRGYVASCLFGNSTVPSTVNQFRGRGPYDAILIDGDHRLPGVTFDWINYGPMARIVAFHDIVGTGQRAAGQGPLVEVPLLWASIKKDHRTVEFVAKGSKMGIGVVLR